MGGEKQAHGQLKMTGVITCDYLTYGKRSKRHEIVSIQTRKLVQYSYDECQSLWQP